MHAHFSMFCVNETFPADIYHTAFIHHHCKCPRFYRIHNIIMSIRVLPLYTDKQGPPLYFSGMITDIRNDKVVAPLHAFV